MPCEVPELSVAHPEGAPDAQALQVDLHCSVHQLQVLVLSTVKTWEDLLQVGSLLHWRRHDSGLLLGVRQVLLQCTD